MAFQKSINCTINCIYHLSSSTCHRSLETLILYESGKGNKYYVGKSSFFFFAISEFINRFKYLNYSHYSFLTIVIGIANKCLFEIQSFLENEFIWY